MSDKLIDEITNIILHSVRDYTVARVITEEVGNGKIFFKVAIDYFETVYNVQYFHNNLLRLSAGSVNQNLEEHLVEFCNKYGVDLEIRLFSAG